MTISDVARLQNCSERNARRYCVTGYRGHVLPSTIAGSSRSVTEDDFKTWRADCGFPALPEPEPETAPTAVDLSPELPKDDAVVSPETAPDVDDLEFWSTERLERERYNWIKSDDPNGPLTNVPAFGSSTHPNPENFARFQRASLILQMRSLMGAPEPQPRPRRGYTLARF